MKTLLLSALACGLGLAPVAAATVYAIDFDTVRISSSNSTGPIDTEVGFTSLDATNGGSSSVTIDLITFELFTTNANASRIRTGPNSLTRDFIFEDGGGAAVGILLGGAGDLPAGDWMVEVWAWDSDFAVDPVIIGSRRNGTETIQTSSFAGSATDPFTFTLTSDGVGAYDVFVRENSASNRTRMNAIRLTLIPEPSSGLLALLAGATVLLRRRR